MTALDQAFIKAFAQQVPSPATSGGTTAGKIGAGGAAASSGSAGVDDSRTPLKPPSESLGGVWAALERSPKPAVTPPPKAAPAVGPIDGHRPGTAAKRWSAVVGEPHRDESLPVEPIPERSTVALGCAESPTPAEGGCPTARHRDRLSTTEQPTMPDDFKPAWHVQGFTWPKVCRHILREAGDQVRALAASIAAANGNGPAVFAIAGCRRGEGATTLLLCIARQLVEQGVHTAVVDADRARPALAKRLGVQPQLGWDEAGGSCGRAVVEAAANRMALVPLAEPSADSAPLGCDWPALAVCLRRLRSQYDIVLVDVGPVEDAGLADRASTDAFARAIDGVLLVHNERLTSTEQLSDVESQLSAAGTTVLGIIENCVSGQAGGLHNAAA